MGDHEAGHRAHCRKRLGPAKANKQLIRDVVKEWFGTLKEKRPEFIDALVSGFADRLDECIELKGGLTRY